MKKQSIEEIETQSGIRAVEPATVAGRSLHMSQIQTSRGSIAEDSDYICSNGCVQPD